jgi:hypothetical protein
LSNIAETSKAGSCSTHVAIGPTGDAVYLRCFDTATTVSLESYVFTKSTKTWGPKTTISGPGNAFFPDLALDATGTGSAVWLASADVSLTNAVPVSSTFTPGAGWSAPSAALGAPAVGAPAVFASPNGRAFAGWREGTDIVFRKIR